MSKVVISKGKDIVKRTEKALEKLEPTLPPKNSKILIKPNLVEPLPKNSGAVTRPEIIEGIIKYLNSNGKFNIIIGEGCSYTGRTKECFEKAGYYLENKYDVKIVPFDENEFVLVKLNGEKWKEIKISKITKESDYIISAAVLKEHGYKVTLALKNMMGILEPRGYYPNKDYMHRVGFVFKGNWSKKLCDLLTKFKPDLSLIDGTTAMYGSHLYGELKRMDLTIVGEDPVAVDSVASNILGHEKVFYIEDAEKRGIGSKKAEIVKVTI